MTVQPEVPRPRVVVVSVQGRRGLPPGPLSALETVADVDFVVRDGAMSRHDAERVLAGAQVVAVTPKVAPPLDRAMLAALPGLRAVTVYATGYDFVDTAAFAERGVALAHLPDYGTVSVAEHAMAMLLSLSRRIHLANDRSRGTAHEYVSLRGFDLAGRTLGIVGLGRIGGYVARLGAGFGMTVVAADPAAARASVPLMPLAELLRRSHAVVVAASRVRGAPPVLGPAELALMPQGAVLVNVSRSELVDTEAAIGALRDGRLRGYAVDDTVADPVRHADVIAEGRLLQTGHSAWWADDALARGADDWVQSMIGLVTGAEVALVVPGGTAVRERPGTPGMVATGSR